MRYNYLTLALFAVFQPALAQAAQQNSNTSINQAGTPSVLLDALTVTATQDTQSTTVVMPAHSPNIHTLGEAVEKVSGVQSGSFGPHASTPIIRGLLGNRVHVKEDHANVDGLNAINPTTSLLFDPIFSREIDIIKNNDVIKSGGHAIGGNVAVDSGLISRELEDKSHNLSVVLKSGTNAPNMQGLKANINNQENISINFLYSGQKLDSYDIVGNSKADVCHNSSELFRENAYGRGQNEVLARACQVEIKTKTGFNPKAYKYVYRQYIDLNTFKFTQDYYDNGLAPKDIYTNAEPSKLQLITKQIVDNPQYQAGEEESKKTLEQIIDRTENYHKKLGNSHLDNQRYGISASYFLDNGHVAAAIDYKTSHYGLPGFSLSNLSYGKDYKDNKPVTVNVKQTKYLAESELYLPNNWLNKLDVNVARVDEQSQEYVGDAIANDYRFISSTGNVVGHHQIDLPLLHPLQLRSLQGEIGMNLSKRNITGTGEQRYLPDVTTQKHAVFLSESMVIKPFTFNAGYRHEQVKHDIKNQNFKLSRNAQNFNRLVDTKFGLNSYELGAKLDINKNIAISLRHANAMRAPEINELYASNIQYSAMTQAEGNQKLQPEKVVSQEISALLDYQSFDVKATAYRHNFDGYYYLEPNSLVGDGNQLPLKKWKQIDTAVTGFEVDAKKRFTLNGYGQIEASVFADLVKNKPKHNDKLERKEQYGNYLTNIPTNRYGAGLNWSYHNWQSGLNLIHYAKPKYLGKDINIETPLPSYNMLDANVSRTFDWKNSKFNVFLSANNLLNQDARPQNSPLRYIAPLPARSFNAGVSVDF